MVDDIVDCLFIQKDLNEIHKWCVENELELNINKCKSKVLTRQLQLELFNYTINTEKL